MHACKAFWSYSPLSSSPPKYPLPISCLFLNNLIPACAAHVHMGVGPSLEPGRPTRDDTIKTDLFS